MPELACTQHSCCSEAPVCGLYRIKLSRSLGLRGHLVQDHGQGCEGHVGGRRHDCNSWEHRLHSQYAWEAAAAPSMPLILLTARACSSVMHRSGTGNWEITVISHQVQDAGFS